MINNKVDWTLFLLIPAWLLSSILVVMSILRGHISSSITLWVLVAVWFTILLNALLHHKKVSKIQHILATIIATGIIILFILIFSGIIS